MTTAAAPSAGSRWRLIINGKSAGDEPLREAVARAPDQPLIAAHFGHALISTEDGDNFEEAKNVLRSAIGRDNTWPIVLKVQQFFDDQKAAALEAAEDAAARAEMARNG